MRCKLLDVDEHHRLSACAPQSITSNLRVFMPLLGSETSSEGQEAEAGAVRRKRHQGEGMMNGEAAVA